MPSIKMQLETLSAERDDAKRQAQEILEKASNEGAELTESLTDQVEELTQKAETADESIKVLLQRDKDIAARLERLQGFDDHSEAIANAKGVNFGPNPAQPQQQKSGIPGNVQRYGRLQFFKGELDGRSAEERAYRFGAWAMSALSACMPQHFGQSFRNVRQFAADQFGMPLMAHGEGGV